VQWEPLPYQVNKQQMNQTPDQLHADLMKDTMAFPVLSAAELQECAEFGTRSSFAAGDGRSARSAATKNHHDYAGAAPL
jgi:hypothetical protein